MRQLDGARRKRLPPELELVFGNLLSRGRHVTSLALTGSIGGSIGGMRA